MRFFRIPSFTGIETHRDDADRGSLRTVEGCIPHGPGGLRSGPVWDKIGEVTQVSSDQFNQAAGADDDVGNSALFVSRNGEVHDMMIWSKENTALVSIGANYPILSPGSPYWQADANITPIGNRLYAVGDGSVEASYVGDGPPDMSHSVFPDETIYSQEWARFTKCQFYVQGPRKTIYASGNPSDPLVVYVSEPAGMTQPVRDNPYSTPHANETPGIMSQVRILSSNATKITALSTRGDKVLVHTDKGCHLLLAPSPEQASTGYRTEQVASTNTSAAVNNQVVAGDGGTQPFWLGFDGAIYKDSAAARGAEDFKSYSDPQQASWKSKGRWEQDHPNNLENSFATYDPQSGMYWVFIESEESPLNVIPEPSIGPTGLSLIASPADGPTGLSAVTPPKSGPLSLSAILQPPVAGPTSLELISAPSNGPTSLSAIQPSPVSGPTGLSADKAVVAPTSGPTSLNAEKLVTLEWNSPINNGWTHTLGLREDFAGLPGIANMVSLIRDRLVDTSVLRTSNPYTISGTDASHFTFSTTGTDTNLLLIGPLDYETKNSYSIVITVHATNGDTLFMNFNLDVIDVAEAPTSGPTGLNAANVITAPSSGPTGLSAVKEVTAVTCSNLSGLATTSGVHHVYYTETKPFPNLNYQNFSGDPVPTTLSEMNNTGTSSATCSGAMTAYFPGGGITKFRGVVGMCNVHTCWVKLTYAGNKVYQPLFGEQEGTSLLGNESSISLGHEIWGSGTGLPAWSASIVLPATSDSGTIWVAADASGTYYVFYKWNGSYPNNAVGVVSMGASSTTCDPFGGPYHNQSSFWGTKGYVAAHPRTTSWMGSLQDGLWGGSAYKWDDTLFQVDL